MQAVSPKQNGHFPVVVRLLPSFTDLAFLIPILFLFVHLRGAKTLLGDGDTGWHIRTGEWILQHHAIPRADMFSFSKPGEPWFAWEWAWDVAFASIHTQWGLTGVVFTNVLLLGVIFVLLFRTVQRRTENNVIAISVTVLAIGASSIHWLARPHLMGWLFLLIFNTAIGRARDGKPRMLWMLPIVTVLWANVHASFFIGIALLLAFAAGDAIAGCLWGSGSGRAKQLLFAAILCGLASVLNPYGLDLHRHVLSYLLDSKQLENIGEYQSMSFHAAGAIYFEISLLLGVGAACWCFKTRRVAEGLILGIWTHLALMSCRNIPVFAFFAAPAIAAMLQEVATGAAASSGSAAIRRVTGAVRDLGADHRALERAWRFHLPVAICFLSLLLLFTAPARSDAFIAEYDPHAYPAAALRVLQENPSSRIFADDEWGDYLIYKLYPRFRVFVDGRSDFYGAEMDERLLKVVNADYKWQSVLARYSIDTVLLRAEAPLTEVLKHSSAWRLVYDDGIAIVFRATITGEKLAANPTHEDERLLAYRPGSLN